MFFFLDDLGANRVIEKTDLWKYLKGLQQYFMDNHGIFTVSLKSLNQGGEIHGHCFLLPKRQESIHSAGTAVTWGSYRTTSLSDLTKTECPSLSLEGKVMAFPWVSHIMIWVMYRHNNLEAKGTCDGYLLVSLHG